MPNNLRLIWDGLHHRLTATATSSAVGFDVLNLFDGSRHSFWRATGTGEQLIMWDAGSGHTEEVDTTVIARADRLVAVSAHVSTQWSADASSGWTDTYPPETPLVTGDLKQPTGQDYYIEHPALLAKRAWRLRLYGTPTSAAECALVWLGKRREVQKNPLYGGAYGRARIHRGANLEFTWRRLSEAGMTDLLQALQAVSPAWPAEGVLETRTGAMYGGRPHFLYDPTGEAFRLGASALPALLHVLLTSPEVEPRLEWRRLWNLGPVTWRQATA